VPLTAAQPQLPTAKALPPVVNQSDHAARANIGQQGELATGPEPPAIDRQRLAQAEELILSRAVDNNDVLQSLAAEIGTLEQAAQRGDPAAAYDAGYCYEHGIGVSVDRAKAYAYHIRSAVAQLKVRAAALSGAQTLIVKLTDDEYDATRQLLQTNVP
jgi:TPR repeat protein